MTDVDSQLRRAKDVLARGDRDGAEALCRTAMAAAPGSAAPWRLLSEIDLRRGRTVQAVEAAAKAAALAPRDPFNHLHHANCLSRDGRRRDALAAVRAGAQVAGAAPDALDALGAMFSLLGEQAEALALFERAVATVPANPAFQYNLATAQRMTGALDAAEASCERALAGNPKDCQAHYLRSDLRRQTPANNHIAEMEALLATNTLAWRAEVLLRFALAKEQEDIGAHPQSFAHLKVGADLHRQHIRYDVRDDIAAIDEIVRTHDAPALRAAAPGHHGAAPIFIVGLPRTGTTLVERIVASHSAAQSLGELTEFGFLVTRAGGRTAGRQDLVRKSLTLDMAALGRAYIERTQLTEAGQALRFIDKMPQNYLYCGLIHAALPDAKIILLHRRPLDACYAVYKAHFSGAYPFSFDLGDLGEYYLAYRRLAAHWKSVLPPACLFEIAYEDIVADLAGAARRILDFLDLPWEEDVRRFHESAVPSTTASAVQVRRPIYATSIGKWRPYARELAPLRARLAQVLGAEELE